jgi:4-amino-4-deoxy-L-arabinose transferase-like glycosyltransferase
MNMFVPVLMAMAALLLNPRPDADGHERARLSDTVLRRIFLLLLANALLFSVLGGALLTRYLLPMYPLVLLVAVTTFYRRVPFWPALAVFAGAAFAVGLFINPPYGFAPEDNLDYAHVIRLHQAAIAQLSKRYPGATVLTAWPMSDELTRPELGYVKQPWDVDRIEDFTQPQIARAAEEPAKFSAALVFSTKYDPPRPLLSLGAQSEALDEQYFGLHHDLAPEQIAKQLGGETVWYKSDDGQWAALIRFERVLAARMEQR